MPSHFPLMLRNNMCASNRPKSLPYNPSTTASACGSISVARRYFCAVLTRTSQRPAFPLQVMFGLLSLLDGILPVVTPCYFFTKACVLAWAASSARPYGGRWVINRAFEIINDKNCNNSASDGSEYKPLKEVLRVIRVLRPAEEFAAQFGFPRRALRLAIFTVAVAARTFALGVVFYLVLAAEGRFSELSTWTQWRISVIAGASWPLYATLLARARSAAAAERSGDDAKDDITRRLGPAAVQWLSYWPMFALFLAVLDPIMGWVPHFYSFKLVVLAFLALPQTRGAYLITSLVLYGEEDGSGTGMF